jgi:xanthine dehydrogenase accessory factor
MRRDLLELAADLARRGEPFALATVVGRKAPVSTHVGDIALVTRDGSFHGWVGGSCTRPTVLAEALHALTDGRPRRVVLDPEPVVRDDGAHVFPMTCHSGGSVEIHIQPVLPAPHLVVYGVSPTARALGRLAKAMGYAVSAVDPMADASAFPQADTIATEPAELRVERGSAPVFAVVATQGQWDEDAILAALALSPDYVAVVASARRFAEMCSLLAPRASSDALARIRNPAGLDLGAQTPEEIALSILAEIVKQRPRAEASASAASSAAAGPAAHGAAGASGTSAAAVAAASTAGVTAIDPVCGMSVVVKGARHRATHDGEEYYFCNAGCRERFVANPGRYLSP